MQNNITPHNNSDHGLTDRQVDVIRSVLRQYKDHIDDVALFGSRAVGNFKPHSDIDLVLYGPITPPELDRIVTLFDESSLPLTVDVQAYDLITYLPLKDHIDRERMPFLSKNDF